MASEVFPCEKSCLHLDDGSLRFRPAFQESLVIGAPLFIGHDVGRTGKDVGE